jgi:hypothetical protein
MATPTKPARQIARLLREGARLVLIPPGQVGIDLTPDILALLDGVQTGAGGCKTGGNLFEPRVHGRDLPTRVHFPWIAPSQLPT